MSYLAQQIEKGLTKSLAQTENRKVVRGWTKDKTNEEKEVVVLKQKYWEDKYLYQMQIDDLQKNLCMVKEEYGSTECVLEKKREEEQDLIRNKKNICRVKAVIYILICLIIVVLSVLVIRMISKNA